MPQAMPRPILLFKLSHTEKFYFSEIEQLLIELQKTF